MTPFMTSNTDGSVLENTWTGFFFFFFSLSSVKERTSTTANNIAEVWAVRNALQMSWELGYKHEVLESDSTFVNSYLKSHGGPTLSALAWNLFFSFFKANGCANACTLCVVELIGI